MSATGDATVGRRARAVVRRGMMLTVAMAGAWLPSSAATGQPSPRTHRLPATPATVAYGYYWAAKEPAQREAQKER